MQVAQLLGGRDGRAGMLASARRHLEPGGLFAIALADPFEGIPDDEELVPPLPDVREEDGWVYSSTPVDVREETGATAIDRLRQAVSPTGELDESMATIRARPRAARRARGRGARCRRLRRARAPSRAGRRPTTWAASS